MKSASRFFRNGLLAVYALAAVGGYLPSPLAKGTIQDKAQTTKDPNAKKKERELGSVYKTWIEEDVPYIITDEERRAFKALKTDEERDKFIEFFWYRRDPDPDTPENEYKDQYYERKQYANEHFASGVPGWKTDRGRIYIMHGKPDEIEPHPAGGPYDRPSYEGGGTTTTYPFEVWWYRNIDGISTDVEIEFVDPTGSGEYRIARNPNEKDAMLYVPNAGQTLAEQLGLESKADRVAMANGFGNGGQSGRLFGSRAKDGEFERLDLANRLRQPPLTRFNDLEVKAGLPEIVGDVLPFSIRTDFMRLSGDSAVTMFTVQFDHRDIAFKNEGGIYRGTVNLYARVTSVTGQVRSTFGDVLETSRYTEAQMPAAQTQRSLYQKNVVLSPARYKIDVVARDVISGKTGVLHHSFEVPRYSDKELSTSTLVLASSIQSLSNQVIQAGPFVLGSYKVEPYVSGVYKPGQTLAMYLQVYNAEMDQATLKPALKVEYVVFRAGREVMSLSEDGRSKMGFIDMKGSQLTVVRAIRLTSALGEPGSYTVKVRVTDLVTGKMVEPAAQFVVINR
jgi:GWxTD domain-containing protein